MWESLGDPININVPSTDADFPELYPCEILIGDNFSEFKLELNLKAGLLLELGVGAGNAVGVGAGNAVGVGAGNAVGVSELLERYAGSLEWSVDITFVADFSTCNPRIGCVFWVGGALLESTIFDDNSVLLQANKAANPIIREQESNISLKCLRQLLNGLSQCIKVFTNSIMCTIAWHIKQLNEINFYME